ncbi:MAG: hypothetical protein HKN16_07130, partial [Saprospiraceae bacterium]|nr:hypothetical protein [Saprospiraceae bacterium]
MTRLTIIFLCIMAFQSILLGNPYPGEDLLCVLSADAGPDQAVCNPGEMVTLSGWVSDPTATYEWTPSSGLSNPFSLNPTATITNTITYTLEAQYTDPINLVTNGDFNAGAVAFTSDYIPGTGGPCGLLSNEGEYAVANDPSTTHTNFSPCQDHTGDATGNMMVINGAAQSNQNVWCQTVSVNPGTDYEFGAWVAMVISSSPAILQFSINGILVGSVLNAPPTPCAWTPFTAPWNSGGMTTAEICIVNLNTAPSGNDFAIDDITFNEVCTATDEVTITVNEPAQTFVTETVCPEDNCVFVDNSFYCGEGSYIIDLQTFQGCDSTVFLDIVESVSSIITPPLETLTCENTFVLIEPIIISDGQAVDFQWSGPNGFLSVSENILAVFPGQYDLVVQVVLNGTVCSLSESFFVEENSDTPVADAGADVELGCGESFPVQLSAIGSSSGTNISYQWTGPGVNSDMQDVQVSQPGLFNLIVTNTENDCFSVDAVLVSEGSALPEISPTAEILNCDNEQIVIDGESQTPNVNYTWLGPNGFTSFEGNPSVMNTGWYYLTVSAGPGCVSADSILIEQDTLLPPVGGLGNTISCLDTSVLISVIDPDSLLQYSWTGPNGYLSSDTNSTVNSPGTYTLFATGQNGCVDSAEVDVLADLDVPLAMALGGLVNCAETQVQIEGSSDNLNVDFLWSGPNGFSSAEQSPLVDIPGTYNLEVIAENGCSSSEQALVEIDTLSPSINIPQTSITCAVQNPTIEASSSGETFSWTGPNGFVSDTISPTVVDPGIYTLVAVADNGCSSTDFVEVDDLVEVVEIGLMAPQLTCTEDSVEIALTSTDMLTSTAWTGPGGFSSNAHNPNVSVPGWYNVDVISSEGCLGMDSVLIEADASLPDIYADGGTLFCDPDETTISGGSATSGATISWSGPGDFSSTEEEPTVNLPGEYTLTIAAPNGCEISSVIHVIEDIVTPDLLAEGGIIGCGQTDTQINTSSVAAIQFEWSGPGGFSSNDPNPLVSMPGNYSILVTGANGCTSEQSVLVDVDENIPDLELEAATLNCDLPEIFLEATSPDQIQSYSWTGPNGFSSSAVSPEIN